MLTPADNRYGLPPFYSLHAWIWRDNPAGMFSMWNPDVSCVGPEGADEGHAGHAELIPPNG
ncbi:MAG: hypothetical protein JO352_23605 [Chloroflexi bacterium]|nr:hypothetical protein [Chloroflexota bacterium]